MSQEQLCVVLNNQYREKVEEAAKANRVDPERITIFQPYQQRHMVSVKKAVNPDSPLPVFLVQGNYGDSVSAVGLLQDIEYTEDMSEERKIEIAQHISDKEGLYAENALTVTNITLLRKPISLPSFIKKKGKTPLSPGQWTASVCYFPVAAVLIEAI